MITRIVKMEITESEIVKYYDLVKPFVSRILLFPGCKKVKIFKDINSKTTFFSYSIWESEQDLNNYRYSKMFRETWKEVKQLFNSKPQAWTVVDAFI